MIKLMEDLAIIPYNELLVALYKKLRLNELDFSYLSVVMMLEKMGMKHVSPKDIAEYMQLSFKQVDRLTVELSNRGLILVTLEGISSRPTKQRILEYQNIQKTKSEEATLVDIFEREFRKTFSIIELEMLESWKKAGYSEQQILDALKEAVLAQAYSLRYIDKVLLERSKKHITKEIVNDEKWWES